MNINDISYFQFIEDFQSLNGIYQVSKIVDYASILEDKINLFELYENLGLEDRYQADTEKFLINNEIFYTLTNADDILNNNSAKRVYTIPKTIMGDFVPDNTNISKFGDFVMLMDLGSFKSDDIRIKPLVEDLKKRASGYFNYTVNTSIAVSNDRYSRIDSSDDSDDNIIKTPESEYDELRQLNNENIDLKEKLRTLEDLVLALPRLEARKSEISNEISEEQRRVDLDTNVEQAKLDQLREDIRLAEIDKREKDRLLANVEDSIAENEAEQARLITEIENLRNQRIGLSQDREATIVGLNNRLAAEQEISRGLREDKRRLEAEKVSLNNEIDTKNNQITQLETTISNLEAEQVRLRADVQTRFNEINALNATIATLNEERAEIQLVLNANANRQNELVEELRLERSRLIADAGEDRTANIETEITLDGSSSRIPEGTTVLFRWESYKNDALPPINIIGSDGVTARFTTPTLTAGASDVVYKFLLTLRLSESDIDPGEDDDNSDVVYITVKSPNALPIANAGEDQTAGTGTLVVLDGSSSSDIDSDSSTLTYSWERTGGNEGRNVVLTDPTSSTPSFTSDNIIAGSPAVTHIFTLTVTDSEGGVSTDTTSVLITPPPPPNRAPIANAGMHRTVISGSTVILDASDSYDPDGNDDNLTYLWTHTSTLPSGILEPTLGDNRAKTTSFIAEVADQSNPISHEYTLRVTDSENDYNTTTVVITVLPNTGPVVNAGSDQTVESGDSVTINGSGYDPDGNSVTFNWIRVGGTGRNNILTSPSVVTTNSTLTFTADTLTAGNNNATHLFQLVVSEASPGTLSSSDTVRITVLPPNRNPIANAGSDRNVIHNSLITLDGSQSYDPDGNALTSYSWARTRGTGNANLILNNENTATPSFTSDDLSSATSTVTHVFTLTVTDDRNGTHSDEITITVRLPSRYPIADAGDDQIIELDNLDSTANNEQVVRLNATRSSNPNSGALTYSWRRINSINSNGVTLRNPKGSRPTFTYNIDDITDGHSDITHVFEVTVTNAENLSNRASVNVIIRSKNAAPIARTDANIITVQSGGTVRIESESTDIDNNYPLAHLWTRRGGTSDSNQHILNNITVDESILTFTGDVLVDGGDALAHILQLRVTDSKGKTDNNISTRRVDVVVESNDDGPIANAGSDIVVAPGASVQLSGAASRDPTSTISSYEWTKIGGIGRDNILSGVNTTRSTLSFVAENVSEGEDPIAYILRLKITNADNKTSSDTVIVTVQPGNQKPISRAGYNQSVRFNSQVQLDGSASYDPDGNDDNLTYLWERTDGTGDASQIDILNASTVNPSFTVDRIVGLGVTLTHIFTLTVTDERGDSNENTDTNTVTITVNGPNRRPIANAGIDQTVTSSSNVTLDGSASSDPDTDDHIETYEWTRVAGTKAIVPTFDTTSPSRPTFTANRIEEGEEEIIHIFQLIVTDNNGLRSLPDEVRITITPPNSKPIVTIDLPRVLDVRSGDTVRLSGKAINTDRSPNVFTYLWGRIGGSGSSSLTLNGSTTRNLSFTADTLTADANSVTQIFEFTARNSKNILGVSTHIAIVNILPPITTPRAFAGPNLEIISNTQVLISGAESKDPLGNGLSYRWSRIGGTGNANIALTNRNTNVLTITGDTLETTSAPVTHIFRLTVTDGNNNTHSDDMVLTVLARNLPPIANAGSDLRVLSGSTFLLDGSDSFDQNQNGRIVSYSWLRIGGTGRDIPPTDSDQPIACYVADTLGPDDDPVTHDFTLTVTDDRGDTNSDDVLVTVVPLSQANAAPVANAGGDVTATAGEIIVLDGSGSYDLDNRVLTYLWTIERSTGTGSLVTISNTTSVNLTVNIPSDATDSTYSITLSVNDSVNPPVTDTITLTVEESTNLAPTAVITVVEGTTTFTRVENQDLYINLNGDLSTDPNNNNLVYNWSFEHISGPITTFGIFSSRQGRVNSRNYIRIPHVTPASTTPTVIRAKLTVTDDGIPSLTSPQVETDVTINPYVPPVQFNAIDIVYNNNKVNTIEFTSGSSITLNTRVTIGEGNSIQRYLWGRTRGTGNPNILNGVTKTNSSLTFTADILPVGSPSVTQELYVSVYGDTNANVAFDHIYITIIASTDSTAPNILMPNNFTVNTGDPITIRATATDSGGSTLTYTWSRLSGTGRDDILNGVTTNEATLSIASSDTIAINRPAELKTHVFELAVSDTGGNVARSRITITVRGPLRDNTAPAVSFTRTITRNNYNFDDRTIIPLNTQITNTDNDELTYVWTLTHISGTDAMILDSSGNQTNSLTSTSTIPTENMAYNVTVRVSDPENLSDTATIGISIDVSSAPSGTISPENIDIARAGDIIYVSGQFSSTVSGNSNLIYLWSFERLSGSSNYISMSNTNQRTATIIVNSNAQNSTYKIKLRVTNGSGLSIDLETNLVVQWRHPNQWPVAIAGRDITVPNNIPGKEYKFEVNESYDPDGDPIVEHLWGIPSPHGSVNYGYFLFPIDPDTGTRSRPIYYSTYLHGTRWVGTITLSLRVRDIYNNWSPTSYKRVHVVNGGQVNSVPTISFVGVTNDTVPFTAGEILRGITTSISNFGTGTVTYQWTRIGGTGLFDATNPRSAEVTDSTLTQYGLGFMPERGFPRGFDFTNEINHIFQVRAQSTNGRSATNQVKIVVTPNTTVTYDPHAIITLVTGLSYSAENSYDPNGNIDTYLWELTFIDGTQIPLATLSNIGEPTVAGSSEITAERVIINHSLEPGTSARYKLTLTVTDTTSRIDKAFIIITLRGASSGAIGASPPHGYLPPNILPTADTGGDLFVRSGQTVQLDGSGSSDLYGEISSYFWERIGGSSRNQVVLSDPNIVNPTFEADTLLSYENPVTHRFRLTVTDNQGGKHSDIITITVT